MVAVAAVAVVVATGAVVVATGAVVVATGVTAFVVVVVVGRVAIIGVVEIGGVVGVVLMVIPSASDGFTVIATSNIVVVSADIKVIEVITQLHI